MAHAVVDGQPSTLSPDPPEFLQLDVVRFDLVDQLPLLCGGHGILARSDPVSVFLCGLVEHSVCCLPVLLLHVAGLTTDYLDGADSGFPLGADTITLQ